MTTWHSNNYLEVTCFSYLNCGIFLATYFADFHRQFMSGCCTLLGYLRFLTAYFRWSLKMGPLGYRETPVTDFILRLVICEKSKLFDFCCISLKSRTVRSCCLQPAQRVCRQLVPSANSSGVRHSVVLRLSEARLVATWRNMQGNGRGPFQITTLESARKAWAEKNMVRVVSAPARCRTGHLRTILVSSL